MSFALTKLDEKCEKASVDRLRDREYIEIERVSSRKRLPSLQPVLCLPMQSAVSFLLTHLFVNIMGLFFELTSFLHQAASSTCLLVDT